MPHDLNTKQLQERWDFGVTNWHFYKQQQALDVVIDPKKVSHLESGGGDVGIPLI